MNATLAAAPIATSRRRDDYGRSVLAFEYLCRTVVVLVTVPNKGGYIVNEWDKKGADAVTTFAATDLRAAKAFAATAANAAREVRAANVAAGLGNVA